MGRKRTGREVNVKIAADLAFKAKAVSQDKGISRAEYVSELIRVHVERDWMKIFKDAEKGGEK
jgi:hypothetical protein